MFSDPGGAGKVARLLALLAMFGSDGDWSASTLGTLVALVVAVTCVAARTRPHAAAAIGAATPPAAAATQWPLPSGVRLPPPITQGWLEHPWLTIIVSLVAAIVATTDHAVSVLYMAKTFANSRLH